METDFIDIAEYFWTQLHAFRRALRRAVGTVVDHPFVTAAALIAVGGVLTFVYMLLGEQNPIEDEEASSDTGEGLADERSADSEVEQSEPGDGAPRSGGEGASGSEPADEDYYELFDRADEYRRDGRGLEAAKTYEQGIELCLAADESAEYGLNPDPFQEYARLLYHLGLQHHADDVLERYIEFERTHGRQPEGHLRGLRERIRQGDLRRHAEKYSLHPGTVDSDELPEFLDELIATAGESPDAE